MLILSQFDAPHHPLSRAGRTCPALNTEPTLAPPTGNVKTFLQKKMGPQNRYYHLFSWQYLPSPPVAADHRAEEQGAVIPLITIREDTGIFSLT